MRRAVTLSQAAELEQRVVDRMSEDLGGLDPEDRARAARVLVGIVKEARDRADRLQERRSAERERKAADRTLQMPDPSDYRGVLVALFDAYIDSAQRSAPSTRAQSLRGAEQVLQRIRALDTGDDSPPSEDETPAALAERLAALRTARPEGRKAAKTSTSRKTL